MGFEAYGQKYNIKMIDRQFLKIIISISINYLVLKIL